MSGANRRTGPAALEAAQVPPRRTASTYPEPFASRMQGRLKRPLGDAFGLTRFGVNLTTLAAGAVTALLHAHSRQDEFVYVLQGRPLLRTERGTTELAPGMCVGFPAGAGPAHQIYNPGPEEAVILEVGDRGADDRAVYPDDDLVAVRVEDGWCFTRKDGTPYDAGR